MGYFIDLEQRIAIIRYGEEPRDGEARVGDAIATSVGLLHGQKLNQGQIGALLNGSPAAFERASRSLGHEALSQPPRETAPAFSRELPQSSNRSRSTSKVGARAKTAAFIAEIFGWIAGVTGAILGAVVAGERFSDANGTTYPNLERGIAIVAVSIFQACLIIMISAYIQWRIDTNSE